MTCQFLIDFDGTIALQDTTDFILERFAAPEWLSVEAAWQRGEIDSHTCLARQASLIEATEEMMAAALAEVAIDPDFASFVVAAHRIGATTEIVSDGFASNIDTVLGRPAKALPRRSNTLARDAGGNWQVSFPHRRDGCEAGSGVCKCAAQDFSRISVLIGDGRSDFCVAGKVDFVLAKGRLADHCAAAGIAHRRIAGFADVLDWLAASPLPFTFPLPSPQSEDRADA